MRSHVMRTTSACFAVLRQLRGIRRSIPRTVFQSLVSCLVLPWLDYCNSVLAGIRQLHWLTISWRIDFKLVVLVYKCLHGLAPSYLAHELHHPAESEFRRCLRSASSHELSVPRTRLSTYGDRAFPVAAVRTWNSLPQHVTSAPSLPVFCTRLKTLLRTVLFIKLLSCLRSDIVILDTLIVLLYLLTYLVTRLDV